MDSTASPLVLSETSHQYWRRVAGGDVERMLKAANYQDAAIERFMQYFTTCILPAWGDKPQNRPLDPISKFQPSLNFDNTPIESSFNITSTNPTPTVRLSVEIDRNSAQNALEEFLRRNRGVDQTIDMSWTEHFHRSILNDTAGSFGDMGIGFDLKTKLPGGLLTTDHPEAIPADSKAYFVAGWKAREESITRWELIRQSILDLPGLQEEAPGIVSGLKMVDDFLSGYPLEVGNLISIVATDLVEPTKARVKFYCKVPAGSDSADFAKVFEWLTLGGRITALKNDRALIQRLFDLVHGVDSRRAADDDDNPATREAADLNRYIHRTELAKTGGAQPQVAPCSVYVSLAGDTAEPTAKLILGAKYSSRTDFEIAEGVDRFLLEQEWPCSFGSYVEFVRGCFPGVPLESREDKLHTFICLSRKGVGSDEWTLQTYYNPLYHRYPRD